MRARFGLPLALGIGILAGSSVICTRAGMALPEDVSSAVTAHGRSAHGMRGSSLPGSAGISTVTVAANDHAVRTVSCGGIDR